MGIKSVPYLMEVGQIYIKNVEFERIEAFNTVSEIFNNII